MAFVKGISGNPAGRPKAHHGCQKLRDLIGTNADKIVKRLLTAAINEGDVMAAKLLLERAIPAWKPIEQPTPIPLPADGTLVEKGNAVVAALSAGDLAPGQAASILTALAGIARLVEFDEFEKRLKALEGIGDSDVLPRVIYVDEGSGGENERFIAATY